MPVRDTLKFNDMKGVLLCQTQQRLLRIKDTMEIEAGRKKAVEVYKKWFCLCDTYGVEIAPVRMIS